MCHNKLLINCQQVSNLKVEISNNNIDLFALTETWIREDDTITPLEICPIGYKSISIPRHNQQGGGVAIVYRSTLSLTHNSTYNFQSIECSDFRLDVPSQCNNLVIIYRPPNKKFQQFLNDLYDYMETTLILQGS